LLRDELELFGFVEGPLAEAAGLVVLSRGWYRSPAREEKANFDVPPKGLVVPVLSLVACLMFSDSSGTLELRCLPDAPYGWAPSVAFRGLRVPGSLMLPERPRSAPSKGFVFSPLWEEYGVLCRSSR
jgi:hypothetical protein